jgi:hypothetical protein
MQYVDHVNCQKEPVSIKSSGNILDVENSFGNYHIRTQLLTYDVTTIYGKYSTFGHFHFPLRTFGDGTLNFLIVV